jgi:hypothetical protein
VTIRVVNCATMYFLQRNQCISVVNICTNISATKRLFLHRNFYFRGLGWKRLEVVILYQNKQTKTYVDSDAAFIVYSEQY